MYTPVNFSFTINKWGVRGLRIQEHVNMMCFRHEDLKIMLDSNKDNQKLDAMKRIIGVSLLG